MPPRCSGSRYHCYSFLKHLPTASMRYTSSCDPLHAGCGLSQPPHAVYRIFLRMMLHYLTALLQACAPALRVQWSDLLRVLNIQETTFVRDFHFSHTHPTSRSVLWELCNMDFDTKCAVCGACLPPEEVHPLPWSAFKDFTGIIPAHAHDPKSKLCPQCMCPTRYLHFTVHAKVYQTETAGLAFAVCNYCHRHPTIKHFHAAPFPEESNR